jgi:hypothetical protein
MFCPNCGAEERSQSQFCRGCGAQLHVVRSALYRSETNSGRADTARDEIGRAIADKIRDIQSAGNLRKVVEDVLPQVEKFLESPQERRLRTIRDGVITSTTGIGLILLFLVLSLFTRHEEILVGTAAGLLVLLVGIGIIINAYFFTVPKERGRVEQSILGRTTGEMPASPVRARLEPLERSDAPSVTESTTRQFE